MRAEHEFRSTEKASQDAATISAFESALKNAAQNVTARDMELSKVKLNQLRMGFSILKTEAKGCTDVDKESVSPYREARDGG
jgi:hypothetical protein